MRGECHFSCINPISIVLLGIGDNLGEAVVYDKQWTASQMAPRERGQADAASRDVALTTAALAAVTSLLRWRGGFRAVWCEQQCAGFEQSYSLTLRYVTGDEQMMEEEGEAAWADGKGGRAEGRGEGTVSL